MKWKKWHSNIYYDLMRKDDRMTDLIHFHPDNKRIQFKPGITILKAAIQAKIHLAHKCGGRGSCLTCKVKIEDFNAVTPPTNSERQKLGSKAIQEGFRLGCQTKVLKSLNIEVPEDPLKAAIRKQLEKQKNKDSFWDD